MDKVFSFNSSSNVCVVGDCIAYHDDWNTYVGRPHPDFKTLLLVFVAVILTIDWLFGFTSSL